jgi:hypothetical protein
MTWWCDRHDLCRCLYASHLQSFAITLVTAKGEGPCAHGALPLAWVGAVIGGTAVLVHLLAGCVQYAS